VLYAPERKSLIEAAGLSGCAGVKFRRQMVLCVERRGPGDEGRGTVCEGALRGSDRGGQWARGGASFWHRPPDGGEDAVVFVATGYRRSHPPVRPKLDPFVGIIERILEEDKGRPAKQRHTSKRIFERLRDEHGYGGGVTIVRITC